MPVLKLSHLKGNLYSIVYIMSARLYSEVVSGSESSGDERPSTSRYCLFNWMKTYQTENEDVALQKAIDLSKVIYFYLLARATLARM